MYFKIFVMAKILLLALALLLIGSRGHTQNISCTVVKMPSSSYDEPACFFIYSPANAATSLPVLYLVNTSGDSTAFCRLVQEVLKKTMLPAALIVGVSPAPPVKPDGKKWITPEYVDAKGVFSGQPDKEEMYYQLVSREVMPYIQQNHKISITMLGSDGDAAFTNYVLSNHAAAFQAYLSLQPFALFENEVNMERAKAYFAPSRQTGWVSRAEVADIEDELSYKGRRPDRYH